MKMDEIQENKLAVPSVKLSAATLKTFTRHMLSAYRQRHYRIKQKQEIHKQLKKIDNLSKDRLIDKEEFSKEIEKLKSKVTNVIESQPVVIAQKSYDVTSRDMVEEFERMQKRYLIEIESLKQQISELNHRIHGEHVEYAPIFPDEQLKKIVQRLHKREEAKNIPFEQPKSPSDLELKAIEGEIKQAEEFYNDLKKKRIEKSTLNALKSKLESQKLKLKNLKKT